MSIDFRCPNGHKLSVGDALAGRKARCPVCKVKMYVPEDNSQPKQTALVAPDEDKLAADAPPWKGAGTASPPAAMGTDESESSNPAKVYRPDPGKVQSVRLLAVPLALVAAFATAPVWVDHPDLWSAPPWAKAVLLLAVLQLAYAGWMAVVPDFSTVWMCMTVFAAASAAYALMLAVAIFTPLDVPLFMDLGDVRDRVAAWCFAVLLLMSFMTFACGRLSGGWRRAYELAKLRSQDRHGAVAVRSEIA